MKHNLKILPEYFDAIVSGKKTFEVRFKDRDYQVDDILLLQEWVDGQYTGRSLEAKVTYLLDNPRYCKEGYVIMSINRLYNNYDGE